MVWQTRYKLVLVSCETYNAFVIRRFTSASQKIGQLGEDLACRFLVKQNFQIRERNYTVRLGEIDIIAEKNGVIHFVEVKSGRGNVDDPSQQRERLLNNVHYKKQQKMAKAIQIYLAQRKVSPETFWQIDIAIVLINFEQKRSKVDVLENVILDA